MRAWIVPIVIVAPMTVLSAMIDSAPLAFFIGGVTMAIIIFVTQEDD